MEIPYRYIRNTSSFAHYWTVGIGKELLQKLDVHPNLDEAKSLVPLLFDYDKNADQLVADIHARHGFAKGNQLLFDYLLRKSVVEDEKKHFDIFFNSFERYPSWLDKNKLKIGAEFCQRPGLSALIVLRDYCLMGGYESAAINKPLIYTGALRKGAVKRLSDTVEFWVNITKPNTFDENQEGFKHVMLTRMIHSFSRVTILTKTDWDSSKWGIPINTWDMLATNLGFSLVFLVGLRKFGIKASSDEIAGLFHYWKYVGYLLGIPEYLLPDNEEDAIVALYSWTMTQRDGDADSKALANALQEEPIEAFYPENSLMRKMMREVHLYYNHFLLGPYSCELLNLSKTTIGRFAVINIWKLRANETKIIDEQSRKKAIERGAQEQEQVRLIYQKYNQK